MELNKNINMSSIGFINTIIYHPISLLICGGENGCISVLDPRDDDINIGSSIKLVNNSMNDISSSALSSSKFYNFYISCGNCISEYDIRNLTNSVQPIKNFQECHDEINSISIHPYGNMLASGDDTGSITIFNIDSNCIANSILNAHDILCSSIVFSYEVENELISGGFDNKIKSWDYETSDSFWQHQMSHTSNINPPFIHSLCVPTSSQQFPGLIAAARGDGCIWISLSINDDEQKNEILGNYHWNSHASAATTVQFLKSDDQKKLISGGNDGKLILWNWIDAFASESTEDTFDPKLFELNSEGKIGSIYTHEKSYNQEDIFVGCENCLKIYLLT